MDLYTEALPPFSKAKKAYQTIKKSFAFYIIEEKPQYLATILDEYIYCWNKFIAPSKRMVNITTEEEKSIIDRDLCRYHLGDFKIYFHCLIPYYGQTGKIYNLIFSKKKEIEEFYEYLFEIVDDTIGGLYMFGRGFSEKEWTMTRSDNYYQLENVIFDTLSYKNICITILPDGIDLNKLASCDIAQYLTIGFDEHGTIYITLKNKYPTFTVSDLWKLLKYISDASMEYFIFDGNLTDEKILALRLYRE